MQQKKTSSVSKAKTLAGRSIGTAKKDVNKTQQEVKIVESSAAEVFARVESNMASIVTTLNNQMNSVLNAVSEASKSHGEKGREVVRTTPLDRAAASFKRLVADVMDDTLAEMLVPLIGHRNEIAYSEYGGGSKLPNDFCQRAIETLDHILMLAGVQSYDVRVGERLDPLIHLAVGESRRDDMADGAIAEQIQPGFRSSRGKIIVPAKVRVNRR
jgi:hypothetical protein